MTLKYSKHISKIIQLSPHFFITKPKKEGEVMRELQPESVTPLKIVIKNIEGLGVFANKTTKRREALKREINMIKKLSK